MRFFDRFRTALSRYEEGVHDLGSPAVEASLVEAEAQLGSLPVALRDLLLQWNGGYLFHDEIALYGVAGARPELMMLARQGEGLWIGATTSARLLLDERGRVLAVDEETDARRVEGSSLEGWLDATMAREAILFEGDGEYREGAFDGEGIAEKARRKRATAAVKADPAAPAWHVELAEIFVEEGKPERAILELEKAVAGAAEGDAGLADAWLTLGQLRRAAGQPATDAFVRAAHAYSDAGEAAYAFAQAARSAEEEDPVAARNWAAEVHRLAPEFVAQQRTAAQHLVDDGDLDGAVERIELALAVTPDDAEARQLLALTRARRSLRPT